MRLLGIETSCDETAIAVVENFKILSNVVSSQIKVHKKWGGVVPMLAKREHQRNLVPVLVKALSDAGLFKKVKEATEASEAIEAILAREPELLKQFLKIIPKVRPPEIDAIAVTYGPGLEPALWVGVNFARALSIAWSKPLIPIDHMEGHIAVALQNQKVEFPAIALLISGAHTQLVLVKKMFKYEVIGTTRDDAVGEAFDKVARMLGLPYPGGPEIQKLSAELKSRGEWSRFHFPRPMLSSGDFDFSFSGLKTAVLYTLRKIAKVDDRIHREVAYAFQQAVAAVLVIKTTHAVQKHKAKTLVLGGGVAANEEIRRRFQQLAEDSPGLTLILPAPDLTTDNGAMIALAAALRLQHRKAKKVKPTNLKPLANLKLS